MANREPPPLFDEETNENNTESKDEFEDLFVSAVEVTRPSTHQNSEVNNIEDEEADRNLFSGGGDVVSLTDESPPEEFKDAQPDIQLNSEKDTEEPALFTASSTTTNPSQVKMPPSSNKSNEESAEADDQFIKITITDPQKIGDGMGAYMAYKVTTNTNMPPFKKKNFTVLRRFSDFLGLHDKLAEKHLHVGRIVPPAPEKSVIGMTKIKMSKETEQPSSTEFVEKRRGALERYLNRTANHPVLRIDPDFREFLEMDGELPKATNTSALSGAGVMRLFNRVGDTVNKMTFKMDESDPWFEEKHQQVENLDHQLRKLHASVESLVQNRRELSQSTALFAKSAAMLSNCEEHTALSRALSQLAEVEEKIEQLQHEQANHDFYVFSELLKDYISLIGAVKDVFHQRVKVYQTWQHAEQMLTKKREQKAKMELAGKMDKVPQAREEVIEWEAKVDRGQEEFDKISKMIRKEMDRFEFNRVKDFKNTIVIYMETLMNSQQQLIKYWEAFLPEAKAIA